MQRFYKGSVWTNWEQISVDIPSFYKDYNSLAAFANGLGANGMFRYTFLTSPIDFNDAQDWTWNYLNGGTTNNSTNKPYDTGMTESSLVTFGSGNYKMQMFFIRNNIYYRHRVTSGWDSWKKFVLESI